MKRTIVAIPLAATLLSAADEPKPAQNPTPTPSQAVQTQKSSAPAATQSPTPAPSQTTQVQKPLTPTAQKAVPARVRIGAAPRGERNAFFVGADYQLGMMTSNEQACALGSHCYSGTGAGTSDWGNMGSHDFMGTLNSRSHVTNGFGIMVGYKHFFKKLPEVGLRYYGFFDYAGTDYRYFKNLNSNGDWAQSIYKPTNIFAYGVGTDFLFNPKRFNKENFHFGFFAGVAIGGTSWGPMNRYYQSLMENYGGHIRVSSFNFFFNGGIRFGTKHNGFEIGIKVPTIPTNYYTLNYHSSVQAGIPYRANLQRNFVFYWRYLVSF
ncbi:Outer membrane protein Omp4 [Helicobacter sp. NHP21005]|uniref:outer membrane protein n=1 Tax=Helicobacter felistomachi TaxID=3040201 RepID=UPI0025733EF8|nr:outer membrane beta-barrel protein [Helicobacter sp. NHP21005]BEG56457.1 Outer membrane protein Omp4 [Helicobacter sp. NHP21005]